MQTGTPTHEHWSSRFAFLMAAIGSSVGLGNFWRFPYTAGENGGSIFILVYLVCVALVAFPVLTAEYAIGRRGQTAAVGSIRALARDSKASQGWGSLGWVGMLGSFLILGFYSMIGGWVIIYMVKAFSGAFVGADGDAIAAQFGAIWETGEAFGLPENAPRFLGLPLVVITHTLFMAITLLIVSRGVNRGIALASQILMPLFFIMLLGVVIFGAIVGDLGAAVAYLTRPDVTALMEPVAAGSEEMQFSLAKVRELFSAALGQAFFSVGVGVGLMITYGSYLDKSTRLIGSSGVVAGSDTFVALIAGLAIFPLAFGFGQDPAGGPGLFFVTLPNAFAAMPGALGVIVGGAFFTLALFAAITSSISLLEVSVAYAEDKLGGRVIATVVLGGLCWAIGLGSVYSLYVFDFMDQLTEKLLLPLGGFLVALFAGWIVSRSVLDEEFANANPTWYAIFRVLIRWVAPIGALLILVFSVMTMVTNPPALISALGTQ